MPCCEIDRPPEFLSYQQLADRWETSRVTLWRYTRGIPGTNLRLTPIKIGGQIRFRYSAIIAIEQELEMTQVGARIRRRRRRSVAA